MTKTIQCLWDHHTHHKRCNHATGNVEDYVKSAIEKDLCAIGISDHFPMYLIPKEANVWQYSMQKDDFPAYIHEAIRLREKYKEQIYVKVSSEVDYYPDAHGEYERAVKPYLDQMDYIIGSIHVIKLNGHAWGVDNPDNPEGMREMGVDKVYETYYAQQIELVKTGFFNIIGHCDLPKKYGIRPNDKDKIWQMQLDLLDELKDHDMAMEINTSGNYKPVKEQYPEDRVIQAAIDRDVPICLGSDAHKPDLVGHVFEETLEKAKKMGLTQLCTFNNGEMSMLDV